MMKKIFSLMAIASMVVAGFTSCTQDNEMVNGQQDAKSQVANAIGFKVNADLSHATRGYATTAANALSTISSFRVWAYDATTNGLYMGADATTGREVSNTGTAADPEWTYTPVQFWPVNELNFVAITPYSDASITSNSTASATGLVTLTTGVTVDTDVEDQKDIMFACGKDASNTPVWGPVAKDDYAGDVPLVFKHALSQIVFKGQLPTSGAITKVSIAEITLGNVGKTGTMTFTSANTFFGGNEYITASTPSAFTLESGDLEASVWEAGNGATAGTPFDLTVSENSTKKNAWFLLPQRAAAWVPANAAQTKAGGMAAAPTTGAYLKIRAQLEKDGVVVLGSAATDAIYLPLEISWDRSKKYTYTIEFNGTAALTPITFSVTAEDWTDANPQPGQIDM